MTKFKLLLAVSLSFFFIPNFNAQIGCLEKTIIIEDEFQTVADEFYREYFEIYMDREWEHNNVVPYMIEFFSRLEIDLNNQQNNVDYRLNCWGGVQFDIGLLESSELFVVGILDLDSGRVDIKNRTESFTIESNYFGTNSSGYLIIAAQVVNEGCLLYTSPSPRD